MITACYLPKTKEQKRLEHQNRRAALWARYPKMKLAFEARQAWRQSPAGIERCAATLAKLLAVGSGKSVAAMVPTARQRIVARFANLKTISPDHRPATPSRAQVQPAAATFPQVARTASAAPTTAARPAVVAPKPAVTAPTATVTPGEFRAMAGYDRGVFLAAGGIVEAEKMSRANFFKLTPARQMAFIKDGGKPTE